MTFAKDFAEARREIAKINNARAQIQQQTNLSPQERREIMDEMEKYVVFIAKSMLGMYHDM